MGEWGVHCWLMSGVMLVGDWRWLDCGSQLGCEVVGGLILGLRIQGKDRDG